MSSSGVGPEQDPLEKYYRIEEIERVRWKEQQDPREAFFQEPPEKPSSSFIASFLFFLEKMFHHLKQSFKSGQSLSAEASSRETLVLIKAALEIMMLEDRSQDSQFLKQLSRFWQQLLEHSMELHAHTNFWTKQLKAFIKEIESYPENEEHTFGYYLEEYAGQKWLPFPYMELIQRLHHQYEQDRPSSFLFRWARMIEEILNSE